MTQATDTLHPSANAAPTPATTRTPIEVIIRQATLKDVPAIVSIGRLVFGETFKDYMPPAIMSDYLNNAYNNDMVSAAINDPDILCYIAILPSPPQNPLHLYPTHGIGGFMYLSPDTDPEPCLARYPRLFKLQRIYTDSSTHGTGMAKRMVEYAEDLAREKGYEHMSLGVYPENGRAIAFYKKLGYEKVGEHEFTLGAQTDIDDVMVKKL